MSAKYILALDAGTTSNRAILFDENAHSVAVAQREFMQYFPKPGWVEHDPEEIWSSMLGVVREVLKTSGVAIRDIAAIGVTNQRETTVVWNRHTGRAVYPAIVWQSRQSVGISDDIKARGLEGLFRAKTGLPMDAYFSGTKIAWILENVPNARAEAEKGDLVFGTIDTWLIWKLTGGKVHATDYSNASRTLVYNIRELKWDEELLSILNIPTSMLPEVRSSSGAFGETDPEWFGASIPISGVAGDQQASLFGQGCFSPGMVKNTYGTGCFLLMNTGETACESKHGLVTTIAWGIGGKVEYALEGSVFVAGSAIQWLRDGIRVLDSAAQSEALASSVPDSGGVYVVPAFTGLGAPYWDDQARGLMIGLTRGTTRAHIVRATLESLAYQTKDVIGALEADAGMRLASLNADGGAAANGLLMQFQSDILGATVNRAPMLETTALGAAFLAGLSVGLWDRAALGSLSGKTGDTFSPKMPPDQAAALYAGWQRAVSHAQYWLG